MRLTIVNLTTTIPVADFRHTVTALQRQVTEDFYPEWKIAASLRSHTAATKKGKIKVDGVNDAIIYVGDAAQDPTTGVEGALGYHSTNHGDIPYGFVYLDICKTYGEHWTCTLSHEVLELLGDPSATKAVNGPHPKLHNKTAYYDLEVCDPTQGDSYSIDDVIVSNFVTPFYFGLPGASKDTNFLKLKLKAFGVRPNGYFQFEDSKGAHQIQGEKITEKIAAERSKARAVLKEGRRNTRRANRMLG